MFGEETYYVVTRNDGPANLAGLAGKIQYSI